MIGEPDQDHIINANHKFMKIILLEIQDNMISVVKENISRMIREGMTNMNRILEVEKIIETMKEERQSDTSTNSQALKIMKKVFPLPLIHLVKIIDPLTTKKERERRSIKLN